MSTTRIDHAATRTPSVTLSEPAENGRVSAKIECPECPYSIYTGGLPDWDYAGLMDGHLRQHAPGRALDIAVGWQVIAYCSVCEDGGDVDQLDEGLTCKKCDTCWDIDGTCGERADQ